MITLRRILALDAIQSGRPRLVGDEKAPDRPVRWVHIVETTFPHGLLKGDELVLTTGVRLSEEPRSAQERFVQRLADQNIAALAGMASGLRRGLPEGVLAEADRLGLPVLVFELPIQFVEATEAIQTAVMSQDLALLRTIDDLRRQAADAIAEGAGVSDIIDMVGRLVGSPLFLETIDGRMLHVHQSDLSEDAALAKWQLFRTYEERHGTSPPGLHIAEVRVPKGTWGRLVGLEDSPSFGAVDARLIDEAAAIIGLQLSAEGAASFSLAVHQSLLEELVSGRIDARHAAGAARSLGFDAGTDSFLPIAAAWRVATSGVYVTNQSWAPFLDPMQRAFDDHGFRVLISSFERCLVLLVSLRARARDQTLIRQITETFYAGFASKELDENALALAVGAPQEGWGALAQSLPALISAATSAAMQRPQRWHDARRMALGDLLHAIVEQEALVAFARQQLGPLLDGSSRHRGMLQTLEALFMESGRKADAARRLNLNRQSFYYRLERIESELGVDLDDRETRLSIEVAMEALPLLSARRHLPSG